MARTSIAMVLIAVLIQIAFASKLMNVDSQQLADNEEKETPLKRNSDFYEYMYQGGCYDYHQYCEFWASNGQCYNNMEYMHSTCPYSCNTCSGGMYYKRDATSNFDYNPPRARDVSSKQLGSDNMKRMYGFGNFFPRRPWSYSRGYGGRYYKRDATSNFGYDASRTRDDSRKELGSDNMKRMYGFGNFFPRRMYGFGNFFPRQPWSYSRDLRR